MNADDLTDLGIRTVIRWEDPPERKPRRNETSRKDADWSVVRRQLLANPGRWALISTDENPGAGGPFRYGGFRTAVRNYRTDEHGRIRCDAYARYIGEVTE